MSILCDESIKQLAIYRSIISPFVDHSVSIDADGNKIASYGLSGYGYDIRCADDFKLSTELDADEDFVVVYSGLLNGRRGVVIPPGHILLTRSVEHFRIPRNTLGICVGKSSYARKGIIANITPLEPEWEGYLTIELSNTSSRNVIVRPNEGIAQLIFLTGDRSCVVSYKDKAGGYQNQGKEVVTSKI